jgi:hypothetical protein
MKAQRMILHLPTLLLLVAVATAGCTFEVFDWEATRVASATQTAEPTPTVTPRPTATPPQPVEVAFRSHHGQYVTAMDADDGWLLKQETDLSPCAWFVLQHLDNGNVALMTCHDRYVTAPDTGRSREDWLLRQSAQEAPCGEFLLHHLGDDKVALQTCAEDIRFVTAGSDDRYWPGELQWSLIAETTQIDDWEKFAVLQRYAPPPVIADFDICIGATNSGGSIGNVLDPSSSDRLELSFAQEAGRGCVAELEYGMKGGTGIWFRLGGTDLSPYSQLTFDIKVNSEENAPEESRVELKRADIQEVSALPITGITTEWQTLSLNLSDFEGNLSSMDDMEELVFMFEAGQGRRTGEIYLDNIVLRRD